jgi:hypothetical protein
LNYNEQQIELLVDLTSRLTLRGGHKYVWGDALTRAPLLAQDFRQQQRGEMTTNAGTGGLTYRVSQRFSVYAEGEVGRSDHAYFRTSLRDYERVRIRGSFQPLNTFTLTSSYSYFNNDNPDPIGGYRFDSRNFSAGLVWVPKNSKNVRFLAEYARTTFTSDTRYVIPTDLANTDRSFYRDNGNSGTALIELGIPNVSRSPRISFGGSLWRSAGSRPSHFYQPMARISVPIISHMEWNAEWRWFGLNEPFYLSENFRQHQGVFSVRFY